MINNNEMNMEIDPISDISPTSNKKKSSKKTNTTRKKISKKKNINITQKIKSIINNFNKMIQFYSRTVLVNEESLLKNPSLYQEKYYYSLKQINFKDDLDIGRLKEFVTAVSENKFSHNHKCHVIMCAYLHILFDDFSGSLSGGSGPASPKQPKKNFFKAEMGNTDDDELIVPINGLNDSLENFYRNIENIINDHLINNPNNKTALKNSINQSDNINYNSDYMKKLNDTFNNEDDLIKAFVLYLLHNIYFYKYKEEQFLETILT